MAHPPPVLFHYTSVDALTQIIAGRNLRATRYDQMNDPGEISLGIQCLAAAVDQFASKSSPSDYVRFLKDGINDYADGGLGVFLFSLSEDPDLLSQWRAYAPKGGVAIGFDSAHLQDGFLCDITRRVGGAKVEKPIRPDPATRLIRCVYTDRNGHVDLEQIVTARFFAQNSYAKIFDRTEPLVRQLFLSGISIDIYRTISSIKHGGYAEEREWRCVNFRPDQADYPIKQDNKGREFIELSFDPATYVAEVWVSPHGNPDAIESAVTGLMTGCGAKWDVKRSRLPYRV